VGILTYKEVQNVLFKEKRRHQEILKSASPQVDKSYSRHAIFVISDLQKDFKKFFIAKYGSG
jgi:hypothetical protein